MPFAGTLGANCYFDLSEVENYKVSEHAYEWWFRCSQERTQLVRDALAYDDLAVLYSLGRGRNAYVFACKKKTPEGGEVEVAVKVTPSIWRDQVKKAYDEKAFFQSIKLCEPVHPNIIRPMFNGSLHLMSQTRKDSLDIADYPPKEMFEVANFFSHEFNATSYVLPLSAPVASMCYLELGGHNLGRIAHQWRPATFSWSQVAHVFRQIGSALAWCHDHGYAHGCPIADNIVTMCRDRYVSPDQFCEHQLKLIDFDQSCKVDKAEQITAEAFSSVYFVKPFPEPAPNAPDAKSLSKLLGDSNTFAVTLANLRLGKKRTNVGNSRVLLANHSAPAEYRTLKRALIWMLKTNDPSINSFGVRIKDALAYVEGSLEAILVPPPLSE